MSPKVEPIEISYEDFKKDPDAFIEMDCPESPIVIDIRKVACTSRRFVLNRKLDVTGVSGTGIVAEGVEFSDGTVALRWRGEFATTVFHSSIASVEHIHLHHGATSIEWVDMA